MSEAVTVPSLTMMTSTVSEESLEGGTHTDTHTYTYTYTDSGSSTLKFAKSLMKRERKKKR